jgi:class 3 adenylate cyclase/tetratricopeptide (TPR) repeat protein
VCSFANRADQNFCSSCGAELRATPPDGAARPPPEIVGERKQVTVLFADVMGSMALSESCDPEEWQRLMERFFAILSEGVQRFEGTVDKFTGDGIMALFGAPVAHEDHAQRACLAALWMTDRLAEFSAELRRGRGLNFLVRIGINSGEVVVGEIGEEGALEYTAIGHTVGLAQRMESLAEPGKAYLTDDTAALVDGYLALKDLGEFEVKGSSRPLRVHELTGVGPARGRLDVSRARGFARFVGREAEMAALENAFARALAGEAQVIGIVGEPGVGKSRLCHEFTRQARSRGVPIYYTAGQSHAKSVPLMPVMGLMRTYFGISDGDPDERSRELIAGKLLMLDESLVEAIPLIFDFLAVADSSRPPPRLDPEARRRKLLAVMKRLIRAQSAERPGVNLFEDLHWLDHASEAFLANHVDAVQGTRSLTIVNFRPEYHARWMSKPYYSQIALTALNQEAIAAMLADLLGDDASLRELPATLGERTDGNPFFIEEMLQELVEAGNLEGERGAFRLVRPLGRTAIPATVQVVLSARIDRLEPAQKRALHAAAVIGKEFSASVLALVLDCLEEELEERLRGLVDGGFVYEQEVYPASVYAFKHPLTQEVAYSSQLDARRAADHAAVAEALIARNPDRLDELAALIAGHWEAAGRTLDAARWSARAAHWSGVRDPRQSIRHWRKVMQMAGSLPESEETLALGLAARVLILRDSWRLGTSHEEAEGLFLEADRMARRSGDLTTRAQLMLVYATIRGLSDGDIESMVRLAGESFALAERSPDPVAYVSVAGASYVYYLRGEIERAIAVLDQAIELTGGDPSVGADTTVASPLAYCHAFKGGFRAIQGQFVEGCAQLDEGIELAVELEDFETAGWGWQLKTWIDYFTRDARAAAADARRAHEYAERIGHNFSRTWALTMLGVAELLDGNWERAGEAVLRAQEMADRHRTAVEGNGLRSIWRGEALLGMGDRDGARRLVRDGLEFCERRRMPSNEWIGRLAMAKIELAAPDGVDAWAVRRNLARVNASIERTGGHLIGPLVHVELAELARREGDNAARDRELRLAGRLREEMGAAPSA